MASKADSGHWSFSNAGPRRAGENGATISATYTGEEAKLDAAIEAIRTLPERATALIAAKEEARRDKLIKEYEEVFGKKN